MLKINLLSYCLLYLREDLNLYLCQGGSLKIRAITKLPNSEQSSKGNVKTHTDKISQQPENCESVMYLCQGGSLKTNKTFKKSLFVKQFHDCSSVSTIFSI